MSILDQYPELRGYQLPDWLEKAPDTTEDLVQVARRSLLSAIQDSSPRASLPMGLDLRLIGPSTEQGSVPSDAMLVASKFQQEVREALSLPSLRNIVFDWAGVSEGSAIIHMVPRLVQNDDDDSLDAAQVDEVEHAIFHVLAVHDRLELEAEDVAFASERSEFLKRLRQMTEVLEDQDLALEVEAYGSQGRRKKSLISKRGVRRAKSLFDKATVKPGRETLAGLVIAADIEAKVIVLRAEGHRAKVEIHKVPSELMYRGDLRVGLETSVTVDTKETTDSVGGQRSVRYIWRGFGANEAPLDS